DLGALELTCGSGASSGRLLSWSEGRTRRLWGGYGTALSAPEGHTSRVLGALPLDDGRLLSWSEDRTLRLWGSDGTALTALEGHTSRVLGALRLDDGRLLSWSSDRTLRLWGSDGTALTPLEAWIYSSDDREKIYTWARKHGFDANEIFEGNPGAELGRIDKDRKSTRLNSSHVKISYAVFCLKKKKTNKITKFDI